MTSLKNFGTLLTVVIITLALVFIGTSGIKLTGAGVVSNTVGGNVVVPAYCSFGISNTAVNFGSVGAGTGVATGNLIVVNNVNGNINGNFFVGGGNWIYFANSFYVANTLWNPSSQAAGIGNVLAFYPNSLVGGSLTDTRNTLFSGGSSNFFFGVSVPTGQIPGTYTQNVVMQNTCQAQPQNSITVNSIFYLTVPTACFITLSNTLINFGSINPGSNVQTANLVVDTDTGGNANANILVAGGNWISGGNKFYVANTVWNPSSQASYVGNALQDSVNQGFKDTNIMIVYPPTSSSNNIFYGVAVPPAQASGTYTQSIIMENSC